MLAFRHKRHWLDPKLPHAVFLDGLCAGMLKNDTSCLAVPQGPYELIVQ
jgi:hypothetical protein